MNNIKEGSCKYCKLKFQYESLRGKSRIYCSWQCTMKNNYEKNVVKNEHTCWGWSGMKSTHGYGNVRRGKVKTTTKYIMAHRASWIIHFGEIPLKMNVLHKCDTPLCSRPDHLFLGTHQTNMRDMRQKGRMKGTFVKGHKTKPKSKDKWYWSKINSDKARQIKILLKNGITAAIISKKFDISKDVVYCINKGITWKHITIEDHNEKSI